MYTILFGIMFFLISFIILKICGTNFNRAMIAPSLGETCVLTCTFMGIFIGFGYDLSLVMAKSHWPNVVL